MKSDHHLMASTAASAPVIAVKAEGALFNVVLMRINWSALPLGWSNLWLEAISEETSMSTSRILVIWYSRTGTTRQVGKSLTAALHCDGEEILEDISRGGMLGYLRSLLGSLRQKPSRIAATSKDPLTYDLIVIGTPVWAWSVSSPVRAYLITNNAKLPEVAFFCTLGGAGGDRAFAQMQELVGKRPVGYLAITADKVASGAYNAEVAKFAEALQRGLAKQGESVAVSAA